MSEDAAVSSRGFPAHSNGRVPRKLYMPSHDLQFDLEMARRTKNDDPSTLVEEENVDQLGNPDQLTDSVEKKSLKFGLIDFQHTEIDEQALAQLAIPESLSYHPGLERELRPTSIFIYNRSIALLKTEQIISHVLRLLGDRSKKFTHLEWVDDFSCVLAFTTNTDAIEAFTNLLIRPDEVEGENGLPEAFGYLLSGKSSTELYRAAYEFVSTPRPARPFPRELFEANPKNKLHQPSRAEQLIPFVRFATNFDVKASSSRTKSLFYALNGTRAGQEGVLSRRAEPLISRTKSSNNDRWTHVEPLPPQPSRRLPNASGSRPRRSRPTTSDTLDEELDRFMNKADDVKPLQEESSHNTQKKRGREEEEKDDEGNETRKSRNRQPSLPKVLKPSIELLPDRPSNGGGNLKDELFSTVTTNFDDEETNKKLALSELQQDTLKEEKISVNQSDVKAEERANLESMDVEESTPTTKPTKNRWGPLFRKLL